MQPIDMESYVKLVGSGGGSLQMLSDEYVSGKITGGGEWEIMPVKMLDTDGSDLHTYIFFRSVIIDVEGITSQSTWCISDQEQVERLRGEIQTSIQKYGNVHMEI